MTVAKSQFKNSQIKKNDTGQNAVQNESQLKLEGHEQSQPQEYDYFLTLTRETKEEYQERVLNAQL